MVCVCDGAGGQWSNGKGEQEKLMGMGNVIFLDLTIGTQVHSICETLRCTSIIYALFCVLAILQDFFFF